MSLTQLNVTHFRNLVSMEIEPLANGLNLIHGHNGSGKTSLLEAIHFLSFGRSFRCSLIDRVINNHAAGLTVFAKILDENQQVISVGMEKQKDKSSNIRLNGKDQHSISELTRLIPIRLMNSQSYSLLDGGPVFRRKYLDWGLFYAKSDFLELWQKFTRVLKQRNAALRARLPKREVEVWTQEIVQTAILFDQARRDYVDALFHFLFDIFKQFLNFDVEMAVDYQRGWASDADFATVLEGSYHRDAQLGYTHLGPHKADLRVLINGVPAKDFLSRGQQKLLVYAMILAQGKLLWKLANKQPIFLIDDLPSELDARSLTKIMSLLMEQKTQVFVTAIDPESMKDFSKRPMRVFHVEQGRLKNET